MMLTTSDQTRVREALAAMTSPVRLVLFTQTLGCETCSETKRLLDELASLSDKVSLEEHNLILDREQAAAYGVTRAPAIAVVGDDDPGIRFYGLPAGYEFSSLIEAILLVSTRESGLSDRSRHLLASVAKPIDLQVFVTPT
jgi:alkyl hydroperoxide reductase subunit AhpF